MHETTQNLNKTLIGQLPVGLTVFTVLWTQLNQQAAPLNFHQFIYYKSHIDEFTTFLLHTADDKMVKRCLMEFCSL